MTFEANRHILIIVSALDNEGFVYFDYKLQDKYKYWYPLAGFGVVVLVLSMCVSIAFFFPMNRITATTIAENDQIWQKQANIMCLDMKQAVKDHEDFLTTGNLPASIVTAKHEFGRKKP